MKRLWRLYVCERGRPCVGVMCQYVVCGRVGVWYRCVDVGVGRVSGGHVRRLYG